MSLLNKKGGKCAEYIRKGKKMLFFYTFKLIRRRKKSPMLKPSKNDETLPKKIKLWISFCIADLNFEAKTRTRKMILC
jgi:hypothetical protein